MSFKDYLFDGERELTLRRMNTSAKGDGVDKKEVLRCTAKNLEKIAELQERLYAQGREGVIVVLQAMDAAGKDSTIKHVMSGIDPQGVDVYSFKQPSGEDLAHDYLWRAVKSLPTRGKMAIFNRSYYEDVLVVKVHSLQKNYKMAARCIDDPHFFEKRYRQIAHFEEYLYENSYRLVKIFLNVSQEEQKERFLERIDKPEKNWKFSESDLKEREHWEEYMDAYEDAINATATEHSPWYVFPADNKWYTRYLVSEAVLHVLEDIAPEFPDLPAQQKKDLAACKAALADESDE